jgi:hypothetical protein
MTTVEIDYSGPWYESGRDGQTMMTGHPSAGQPSTQIRNEEEYFRDYGVKLLAIRESFPPQITMEVPIEHADHIKSVLRAHNYHVA